MANCKDLELLEDAFQLAMRSLPLLLGNDTWLNDESQVKYNRYNNIGSTQ